MQIVQGASAQPLAPPAAEAALEASPSEHEQLPSDEDAAGSDEEGEEAEEQLPSSRQQRGKRKQTLRLREQSARGIPVKRGLFLADDAEAPAELAEAVSEELQEADGAYALPQMSPHLIAGMTDMCVSVNLFMHSCIILECRQNQQNSCSGKAITLFRLSETPARSFMFHVVRRCQE